MTVDIARLNRDLTLDMIDRLGKSFATGRDPGAVLHAIWLCLRYDVPVPEWAKRSFIRTYAKGLHGNLRPGEWFKPARTKAQAERRLRQMNATPEVWRMVEGRRFGEPIDDKLFQRIGRELGIGSKTLVKHLYAMRPSRQRRKRASN